MLAEGRLTRRQCDAYNAVACTMAFDMAVQIPKRVSLWPRFSRYEPRGGRIAPARGAKLEWYDPWQEYQQARTKKRAQPPYVSLISLFRRLTTEFRAIGWTPEEYGSPQLSKKTLMHIFDWSSRHGLAGVFHQSTVQIDDPSQDGRWTWTAGRWERSSEWRLSPPRARTSLITMIPFGDLALTRADKYLSKFLVRRLPGRLPAPNSNEFFRLYCEPFRDWIVAVTTLAEAISRRDLETLNMFAGRAARVRWFEGGRVSSKIMFPSLLSAFAEMCSQDFEEGALLRNCAHCGEPFVTRRRATYCSPRCATNARQHRFLQRNPDYHRQRKGRRS